MTRLQALGIPSDQKGSLKLYYPFTISADPCLGPACAPGLTVLPSLSRWAGCYPLSMTSIHQKRYWSLPMTLLNSASQKPASAEWPGLQPQPKNPSTYICSLIHFLEDLLWARHWARPRRVDGLQTAPSSVPPWATSNIHCFPGAPSSNTFLISLSGDLANFREGLLQLCTHPDICTQISSLPIFPSFLPTLSGKMWSGFHYFPWRHSFHFLRGLTPPPFPSLFSTFDPASSSFPRIFLHVQAYLK